MNRQDTKAAKKNKNKNGQDQQDLPDQNETIQRAEKRFGSANGQFKTCQQ
jgi:hypothetical protein